MAKALYGHMSAAPSLISLENAKLRTRIAELQAEVAALRAENDALISAQADALIESSILQEA